MGKSANHPKMPDKYKSRTKSKTKKKMANVKRQKEKIRAERNAIRGILLPDTKPKEEKKEKQAIEELAVKTEEKVSLASSSWDKIKNSIPDRKKKVEEPETKTDDTGDVKHPLIIPGGYDGKTKFMAMDCEMVGVGYEGIESALARVSIVNFFGHVLYDEYCKPLQSIVDYRTEFSGILPEHMVNAKEFFLVQTEVAELLKNRFLVGHALTNDLKCLFLDHPKNKIRDTATYKPFHKKAKTSRPKLKVLASLILKQDIQGGEHNSVEDAQAAMRLYVLHRKEWEQSLLQKMLSGKKSKPEHEDYVSDMLQED